MIRMIQFLLLLCLMNTSFGMIVVKMNSTEPSQNEMGSVAITETPNGLLFTPQLKGLSSGMHGFHIHQNPSCTDHGMAAGSHFDPKKTNKHLGPYNNGHLGDLPVLYVNADGTSRTPVLAPRLKSISEIKNHALMIHEGGDTYSDVPPLGGGGGRMECGLIQ